MGCLFAIFAAFTPRLALGLVWIFTNLVDRAFSGFLLPLLGLLVLPYATLFYVLAWSPVGGLDIWGWLFVVFGFFLDLGHWAAGYATNQRRTAMA